MAYSFALWDCLLYCSKCTCPLSVAYLLNWLLLTQFDGQTELQASPLTTTTSGHCIYFSLPFFTNFRKKNCKRLLKCYIICLGNKKKNPSHKQCFNFFINFIFLRTSSRKPQNIFSLQIFSLQIYYSSNRP